MKSLSIDIETYSGIDLLTCGVYKYVTCPSFEIMLIAFAFDEEEVNLIDLTTDHMPKELIQALTAESIVKTAFNATFERICLNSYLRKEIPTNQWHCTMAHAYRAGLPGSLEKVGNALNITNKKDPKGKALIKYFSVPCSPTKINGGRTRNLSIHAPDKWEDFKNYCVGDVEAEREVKAKLDTLYTIPEKEKAIYLLDQKINDKGIALEPILVKNAIDLNTEYSNLLNVRAKEISGLDNPNSVAQLKKFIEIHEDMQVDSLSKEHLPGLESRLKLTQTKELLNIRKELSKTSVKKYEAMAKCIGKDGRARGLLQYYGANRTGRWAGRLIQVQNLPRNEMKYLKEARNFLLGRDFSMIDLSFSSCSNVLSQLIRTAFVPKQEYKFLISDFSAIEARVIAWLANEKWRLDVFNTHGKIYEASAAAMFKVPIENIGKTSELRQKGKVAELALGYQGGVPALIRMGALDKGIAEEELQPLVNSWRAANPCIVRLWNNCYSAALRAIAEKTTVKADKNIKFIYNKGNLLIELPNGRSLSYIDVKIEVVAGRRKITYKGINQKTKNWEVLETYGGKLVENIVQAIARDCLAEAMLALDDAGFGIVMHIHDEVVLEVPISTDPMEEVNTIMGTELAWAKGLPLKGDSFYAEYYQKD